MFAGGAQFALGVLQPSHVEQRDDDAPGDVAIGAAIRKQAQQVLAPVECRRFLFKRGGAFEDRLAVAFQIDRIQIRADLPDLPADIGRLQVERARRGRREPLDAELGVEKHGGDIGALEEIPQIVAGHEQLLDLVGQLSVQRQHSVEGLVGDRARWDGRGLPERIGAPAVAPRSPGAASQESLQSARPFAPS